MHCYYLLCFFVIKYHSYSCHSVMGINYICRKKKAVHKATSTDDKRLQSTLKRLGVNTIPGIEEVNLFQADGNVVHFVNPKGAHLQSPFRVVLLCLPSLKCTYESAAIARRLSCLFWCSDSCRLSCLLDVPDCRRLSKDNTWNPIV